MKGAIRYRLAGRLGRTLLDGLFATARFEVRGAEPLERLRAEGRPVIYTLWHGRLLPLTYHHRRQDIVALISRSEDGEYIAQVVERWGYRTVRGSSSRGGSGALRELVRHARAGRSLSFTPDGPRGPRQKVKPGVMVAAQMTGLPIVPMAAGTDSAWWFEGWDRFMVPRPLARIRIAYGEPLTVPRDAAPEQLDGYAAELERTLDRLTREVDGGDPAR